MVAQTIVRTLEKENTFFFFLNELKFNIAVE